MTVAATLFSPDSFLGRACRKFLHRSSHYIETVAREQKAVFMKDNNNTKGQHNLQLADSNFELVVTEEGSLLSITCCMIQCQSEIQSALVMKKALELNSLSRNRLGYTLAILPPPSSSTMDRSITDMQSVGCVTLTLCYSTKTSGMGLDRMRREINDFVEVASNVQAQLESADEGRVGALPRPPTVQDLALKAIMKRPEVMVPMMCAYPPKRKPSPPPIFGTPSEKEEKSSTTMTSEKKEEQRAKTVTSGKRPPQKEDTPPLRPPARAPPRKDVETLKVSERTLSLRSCPSPKLHQNNNIMMTKNKPARAHSINSMAVKTLTKEIQLSQFDSPAEAILFETFMRKKAQYVKKSKQEISKHMNSISSLNHQESSAQETALPPPISEDTRHCQDWDCLTPVISNRKMSDDHGRIIESEYRAVL